MEKWVPALRHTAEVALHRVRDTRDGKFYSGLICTLRNLITPDPYCSANGPLACFESCTSTVFCPLSTTTRCGPCAVISYVFHLPPAFGIGSTLATSTIAPVP